VWSPTPAHRQAFAAAASAEDLVNAWAYYRSHPEASEAQIRENEAA
jgi:hypothetical protein